MMPVNNAHFAKSFDIEADGAEDPKFEEVNHDEPTTSTCAGNTITSEDTGRTLQTKLCNDDAMKAAEEAEEETAAEEEAVEGENEEAEVPEVNNVGVAVESCSVGNGSQGPNRRWPVVPCFPWSPCKRPLCNKAGRRAKLDKGPLPPADIYTKSSCKFDDTETCFCGDQKFSFCGDHASKFCHAWQHHLDQAQAQKRPGKSSKRTQS